MRNRKIRHPRTSSNSNNEVPPGRPEGRVMHAMPVVPRNSPPVEAKKTHDKGNTIEIEDGFGRSSLSSELLSKPGKIAFLRKWLEKQEVGK